MARGAAGSGGRSRPAAGAPAESAERLEKARKVLAKSLEALGGRSTRLYYGDNLKILREHIPDESINLIYLDPPFSSQRDYNLIFKDTSGTGEATAQIQAFEDTWHWGPEAEATLRYLTTTAEHGGQVPGRVSTLVDALVRGVGRNDMTAYLVMMAPRLVEMHRVLKTTGSIYLHCDPTASHYLKLVMDAIFDPRNFRNEIIWKRFSAKNDPKRYGRGHDVLLFYTKSPTFTWNPQFGPFEQDYVEENYRYVEEGTGRRYRLSDLTAHKPGGDVDYEWHGMRPYKGRHWAFSKENMERMLADGRIVFRRTGMPVYKRYLDEMPGVPLQDIWTDVRLQAGSRERLGYPTQKPLALLERIILSSSKIGDLVLDPFCGCGTAIVAAHQTGRRWIGIDITHLAIAVMRARLRDVFGIEKVPVIGEPVDLAGARALAAEETDGRYQFQWWALSLVDAKPVGGEKRKGADRGIDGVITFQEGDGMRRILVSVKSGHVNSGHMRDLRGAVERDRAAMGILISLEDVTRAMRQEAVAAAFYESPTWGKTFPKIQIATIRDLLSGKRPQLPSSSSPGFPRAERVRPEPPDQQTLGLEERRR